MKEQTVKEWIENHNKYIDNMQKKLDEKCLIDRNEKIAREFSRKYIESKKENTCHK